MNYPPSGVPSKRQWYENISATKQSPTLWWGLPCICIVNALLATLLLSDVKISARIYWVHQADVFILINHMLAYLPEVFWRNLTMLGDALVLVPVMALVLVRHTKVWYVLLYAAPLAGGLAFALKRLFEAPRPAALLDTSLFQVIGTPLTGHNSFPSGHTTTAFVAVFAVLTCLYPSPSTFRQHGFVLAGIALASLIGLSRIAIGAHWPLDVLLGAGIGAASAAWGVWYFQTRKRVVQAPAALRRWASCLPMLISGMLCYRVLMSDYHTVIEWVAVVCGVCATVVLTSQNKPLG